MGWAHALMFFYGLPIAFGVVILVRNEQRRLRDFMDTETPPLRYVPQQQRDYK